MTYEICPFCDEKVELENIFELQDCPECGEELLPCSLCEDNLDDKDRNCNECPIDFREGSLNNQDDKVDIRGRRDGENWI